MSAALVSVPLLIVALLLASGPANVMGQQSSSPPESQVRDPPVLLQGAPPDNWPDYIGNAHSNYDAAEISPLMAWNVDKRLSPIHSDDRQYKVPIGVEHTVSLDIESPGDYTYLWRREAERAAVMTTVSTSHSSPVLPYLPASCPSLEIQSTIP